MYRFEIFRDSASQYRFRLVASNGEIVATSESYTTKRKCKLTVTSIAIGIHTHMPMIIDTTKQEKG